MKIDYEYIKEYVESFGYELKSKVYIRSNVRLDMMCDKGHECSISWDNFKYGRRCKTCSNIKKSNMFKFDYDGVRKYIESFGCRLISRDYINNNTKLDMYCKCGEKFAKNFNNFKRSPKCSNCSKTERGLQRRHSCEYVKSFVESFGYKLLSEYTTSNEKILIQCNNNHNPYEVKFGNFHSGKRCPHCSKSYKPTIEEVKQFINSIGYKCLDDEYVNMKQKLLLECDKGHLIRMTLRDLKAGCRCVECGVSRGERKVVNYLKLNNINYIYNSPYFKDLISDIGNPLRPDFILEKYKIWIEYDGEFHYKPINGVKLLERQQYLDKLKDEYANENGWKMIRIPYWEFDNIENILNNNINNKK